MAPGDDLDRASVSISVTLAPSVLVLPTLNDDVDRDSASILGILSDRVSVILGLTLGLGLGPDDVIDRASASILEAVSAISTSLGDDKGVFCILCCVLGDDNGARGEGSGDTLNKVCKSGEDGLVPECAGGVCGEIAK